MRRPVVQAAVTAVTILLWTQSGLTQPSDDLKALTKDFETLRHGQTAIQKEVQDIKGLVRANPSGEEAPRPPSDTRGEPTPRGGEEARPPLVGTRGGATVGGLDDRQRAALVRALAAQPAGTPVWFAVDEQDAASRDLARALRAAFAEAGWAVRAMQGLPFAWRPGVFLYAADSEPPVYVQTAHEALQQAGIPSRLATGYRAYYAEMTRTKPGWQGFDLAPDQTYLVVIGPTPRQPGAETRKGAPVGGRDDSQGGGLGGAAGWIAALVLFVILVISNRTTLAKLIKSLQGKDNETEPPPQC